MSSLSSIQSTSSSRCSRRGRRRKLSPSVLDWQTSIRRLALKSSPLHHTPSRKRQSTWLMPSMLLNTSRRGSSSWQLAQDLWTLAPGPVCFHDHLSSPPLTITLATANELEQFTIMTNKFRKFYPDFTGPITPETSVQMQLEVINRTTVNDTGAFISHKGNKVWL